jgi:endoglucanase
MNPPESTAIPSASPSPLPQPTSTKTLQGLDPFEQNRSLGRGVNLGNALEAPSEGEWGWSCKKNSSL